MSYRPLSSRVSGDADHPRRNHHAQPPEPTTERGLEDTASLISATDTSAALQNGRRSPQRASIDASEEAPYIACSATPAHMPKPSIEYREDAIAAARFSDKPSTTNASDAGHDVKTLTGWWWWEILATLVSVICMVLLIALLCVISETPLSRWTQELEPNSVISILTTASKTALMVPVAACLSQLKWKHVQQPQPLRHMQVFDDASRGPYGSLVMAWKLRFRSPVGWGLAFVTIVALGIGPSAQNLLWIHNTDVEFTNTLGNAAEIGRADAIHSRAFTMSKLTDMSEWMINSDMPVIQAAVINGLIGAQNQPDFACPSDSICRWDDFSSLGVCNTLRNVTDTTTSECREHFTPYLFFEGQAIRWTNQYNCTYNISGRIHPKPPLLVFYNSSSSYSPILYNDFTANRLNGIGQLVVLKLKYDETSLPLTTTNVLVADFHWCLRNFRNTVSEYGVLRTEEDDPVFLKPESTIHQGVWYYGNGSAHPSNNISGRPWQESWRTTPDIYRTPDNKTTYEINARWLPNYLTDLLRLDLYQGGSVASNQLRPGSNATQLYRTSSIFLNMLFHNEDLKTIADRLSLTLTNQMRSKLTGDNANATMKPGRVFKQEPFISVQWPWLLLPLFETVLTAVLLVVSILMTRRDPLLKSSTTALMVFPLEGWERTETTVSEPQNSEKMAQLAEGLRGKLVSEDGAREFVKS